MKRTIIAFIWGVFTACSMNAALASADPLSARVPTFACTNQPLSAALVLLSRASGIPINSVMDDLLEPEISITITNITIGTILRDMLSTAPDFGVFVKMNTLLVAPKGVVDNNAFPLNRVLPEVKVAYRAYDDHKGGKTYTCVISGYSASLNVVVPPLAGKEGINRTEWPETGVFKRTSLLEILTRVSSQVGQPWCCARLDPKYVVLLNKAWQHNSPKNDFLFHQSIPAYYVYWRKGAIHAAEIRDYEAEERAAHEQELRWSRWRRIDQMTTRGHRNKEHSPVGLAVSLQGEARAGQPLLLDVKLTNASQSDVTISNPFAQDRARGFVRIQRIVSDKGIYGEYEVHLPLSFGQKESKDLTIHPNQEIERAIDIQEAPMIFDEYNSDLLTFKGPKTGIIGQAGKYHLGVGVYFTDRRGEEYYLEQRVQFEMRPKEK